MLPCFVLVCKIHIQAIRKIKVKLGRTIKSTLSSKLVISPLLYIKRTIKETTGTISKTGYQNRIACCGSEKRLENVKYRKDGGHTVA
jgi:hypothetical protein